MAAGHKNLKCSTSRSGTTAAVYPPTRRSQGPVVSKPIPHTPADIHEIPLWYFQRHFSEILGPSALHLRVLCSLRWANRPRLAHTGGLERETFSQGTNVRAHTHTYAWAHANTLLTPKVNIAFSWLTWIPIVKFVSLAPDTRCPAPGNPGDGRRAFLVTSLFSRELSCGVCVCVLTPQRVIRE